MTQRLYVGQRHLRRHDERTAAKEERIIIAVSSTVKMSAIIDCTESFIERPFGLARELEP